MQNVSLAFFVPFDFACKQQLIVYFEMLIEILRLYFPLCFHPVLLFLCNFACSPSFCGRGSIHAFFFIRNRFIRNLHVEGRNI